MRKLRSILAAVMAVMLILTAVPFTATAATEVGGFTDFPTGWSANAMTEAVKNGLLSGFGDGTIRPQERLTRAQMAAIVNRAFGAEIKADIAGKFNDVNPGDWYYDDIAKAVNMKTFNGDDGGNMRPNDPITREDAVVVVARALVVSSMSTDLLRNYGDSDTVDGYAQEAICAFLDRGYIRGYEDMTLRVRNYITREEFAQIMDNVFAAYVRVGGEIVLGNSEGEVVITGDNIGAGDTVRISSSYINGDLIIGDGLSTADIIIEDVDVTGRILFRGGEGTVTLKNVKLGTLIVTNDVNGTVNFMHYSNEAYFKHAVYNTPASFLDRTVEGGSASGNGRLNHDTTRDGNNDAKTGPEDKDDDKQPIIVPGGGGSVTVYYGVTFELEDGTEYYKVNNIRYNNTITLPTPPAKTGYTFLGWYYTDDGGNSRQFTEKTRVTKSLTVTSAWKINTYSVTFDPNNGESPQTQHDIPYNTSITLPTEPVKTGYVFGGWFDADGNEFTATTPVTKNMTVTAKWTEAKYTVTFMDGTTEYHKITDVAHGATVTLPTAPTAAGQTFKGWFYTENGIEKEFTSATVVTNDMTVTAKWEGEKFTVTFNPDNGEAATTISDVAYNSTVTLPTEPVKTGYVFGGWFDADGNEFTASTPVTKNMTVTAKWTEAKYTVTFMDGTTEYHKITDVAYGATVTLPSAPTAAGQTFKGWFYTENGVEKEFTSATVVTNDMTVTAKWEGEKFTVTFNPDNGEAATTISDVAYNSTVTLPTEPVKTGYVFGGWFDADGNEFTASTPVTKNMTVTAKWTEAKYTVTFMDGTTEYHKITDVAYGATVTLPSAPVKAEYTFEGWFDINGNAFDETTQVVGDIVVYAKWNGITYTVTFYEIDEERNKVENIVSGGKVGVSDITTATGALDVAEEQGYVANNTNISATYDKNVNHTIPGAWYFKDASGKWQKFDENIAIYSDLDVYYLFKIIKVHANLSSYIGQAGNIPVDVPYTDDTTAYESVLDGIYLANSKVVAAMNVAMNKIYGKTVSYDGISYTPIASDGKINSFEYDYRLIKLLGEATIRSYTEDAIEEMVLDDKALLIDAVKSVASNLNNTSSSEYAAVVEYFGTTEGKSLLKSLMTNNDSFWIDYLVDDAQGRELLKAYLRSQGYSDMAIDVFLSDPDNAKQQLRVNKTACIDYIVSNTAAADRIIEEACKAIAANDTIREDFAEDAATAIQESASKDAAFVEHVVEFASKAYEDKIEEFIDSLKNDDEFVVDADRKFIILALSKKLHNTTYEEVKAKLPSIVSKVLDDAVMRDIYDSTIEAYRSQVDAVKAIVTDAAYDGSKQYVDTFCHITVDPVTQVLKPEYDRFFVNKIDPAIKDNKYYNLNPYIKEIEDLLKIESVLDEKTDGWYVRSAQNYYDLLYKVAVLSTDAGDWFVENVPEAELDDAILTAEKKIGGYLDRLVNKFTFLQNSKTDEARARFEELVRKLVDKNNSELWNSETEVLFTEKLPAAYDKAKNMIMDKLGFNIDNPIIVTVASDNETVTITDGNKTVIKSLSELLKTYADGKQGVSVSGTVITVKGKSVDAKSIVKKLVGKFGNTFTVKIEHSDTIFNGGTVVIDIEDGYKLSINGDYIAVAKQYK